MEYGNLKEEIHLLQLIKIRRTSFMKLKALFDVTLTATNYLGSSTIVLENYINSNTTILPEVNFVVSDTIVCIGDVVQFEDKTIYNPVQWDWEFFPDDVEYVNGTNENSQNPEVKLSTSYPYEVTLTATNLMEAAH